MTTATAKLVGGSTNGRLRCTTCKKLLPAYVDRGDGQPLRRPYGHAAPDPSLDRGPCVMAYEVLDDTCPHCGAHDTLWPGRGFTGVTLKASVGVSACDAICATATGATCRCLCGGMNHGTL